MRDLINKSKWKKILASELPGEKAQQRMAPSVRGDFIHEGPPFDAAVMILIYPWNGKPATVFIKRNEYPGPHSAQVSFPGGIFESDDESLQNAAIRETSEELGIHTNFEVLGRLSPLYIPVSNFLVTPFVGILDRRPAFRPDRSEVQFVIEATLESLMNRSNQLIEKMTRHGISITAPCYLVGKETIWGATAMMLSEFLEVVSMTQ